MAYVQRVASRDEIPAGKNHVVIVVGSANGMKRDGGNITITVDRSVDRNLFEAHLDTAIGEAQSVADREKIETVFVCIPQQDKTTQK